MSTAIAFAVAPLPGLLIYLLGRRLRLDDPAFTKKYWRLRMRISKIAMLSMLVLAALAWRWTPVTLPLFALCVWLGTFPLRKSVFAEEWTLAEYLRSRVRLTLGVMLFWIALLFEPAIVGSAGTQNFGWVIAAMLIWAYEYRALMLWGFEAGPVQDGELLSRLNAVAAKSRARQPEILEIGTPKAHFPNAFAMPHPTRPRVLLSRTLLRHLDADETAAIFAHEVAHLEHYSGKRGRVAAWSMFLLVTLGALMAVLSGATIGAVIWIMAILLGITLRQRRQRARESHCDVRAVELCGDPEVLIRALTRAHALGRIPEQWDREAGHSHPSLVRRIQAIRDAAVTSDTSRTSRDSADSDRARSSAS